VACDVENKDCFDEFKDCDDLSDFWGGVSGWKLTFYRLVGQVLDLKIFKGSQPKWPKPKALYEWLSFMSTNSSIEKALQKGWVDIYVQPFSVTQFGIMDYAKINIIVQAGYDNATKVIQEWKTKNKMGDTWARSRTLPGLLLKRGPSGVS